MAKKSGFVGVRVEPELRQKLILFSMCAGEPGNMSAGLRWALQQMKASGAVAVEGTNQPVGGPRER